MVSSRIRRCIHYGNIFFFAAASAIAMIIDTSAYAGELPRLDELTITAKRPQRYLDTPAANITIIDRNAIEGMQAHDLADILETVGAVDITRKGMGQADVSIRGSSTEGVLLLVDGVRVHDPQTGHFLMDTPFPVSAIEQVEILHGGGSSIYGSSASGGVINIVTGKSRDDGEFSLSGGSFGTGSMTASHGVDIGNTDIVMNIESGRSDGYRKDSDVRYSEASVSGRTTHGDVSMQWNAGVIDKHFGAADFYAPYPSYEEINTVTAGMNAAWAMSAATMMRVRFGGRGHGDDFSLIRDDPDYYRNTHFNRSMTLAGELLHSGERFQVIAGVESERSGITSGSLGHRTDNYGAFYSELISLLGDGGSLSMSLRYDGGDGVFSPGIGASMPVGSHLILRARTGRSFRRPTYTDRYYMSPSNIGDPDLDPEISFIVEAGFDVALRNITARVTGYRRSADDVIDWIRESPDAAWQAANHGNIVTTGLEASATIPAGEWRFRINASRLAQKVTSRRGVQSKYALNPAEASAGAALYGPVFLGMRIAVMGRYERMTVTGSRLPVDISLSRALGSMLLRASIDNIGNEKYEELPGLPASGRWLSAALEYRI